MGNEFRTEGETEETKMATNKVRRGKITHPHRKVERTPTTEISSYSIPKIK